jgi:hypothetical protein
MLPEPLRHGVGRAIRQQGHGLAAFQINEDGAIGLAFAQGEIVYPQHAGRGERRSRLPTEQAQQSISTHGQGKLLAEVHPRRATQSEPHSTQMLGQPQRAPRPRGGHRGQAFGKDTARAVAIAAKPLAHPQLEAHTVLRPGQIREGAFVVTMDTLRRERTERTGHAGLPRADAQGDLCRGVIDGTRREAQRGGIR